MAWQEDTGTFPAPVQWESGQSEIRNGLFVTGDFNLLRPDEIGVHVLYDLSGANKKFYDDFAMRVENYAVVNSSQVQY
jgi:transposase